MKLTSKIFTLIISLGFILSLHTQTPNPEFSLPGNFKKPESWIKADAGRSGKILLGYYGNSTDFIDLQKCLSIIRAQADFSTFLNAKTWAVRNYEASFPYLITLLTDTTTVGLVNTADLIIPGRNLPFYGHGGIIHEDIFTVAGRASHILNALTGESFAVVTPSITFKELQDIQGQWVGWITKLQH